MLVLCILHNIFLTSEQIEALKQGEDAEIIGVSVPVWYEGGNTSEPAEEVFCKYKITHKDKHKEIKTMKTGYQVNIPKPEKEIKVNLEAWQALTDRERDKVYYDKRIPVSIKQLLPVEQGGINRLVFKEVHQPKKNQEHTTIHVVELKTTEYLEKTLN